MLVRQLTDVTAIYYVEMIADPYFHRHIDPRYVKTTGTLTNAVGSEARSDET